MKDDIRKSHKVVLALISNCMTRRKYGHLIWDTRTIINARDKVS